MSQIFQPFLKGKFSEKEIGVVIGITAAKKRPEKIKLVTSVIRS